MKLCNKKAEGYIDVAVAVLILVIILLIAVSVWQMVTFKQDMTYMCEELVEISTVNGKLGAETDARFQELCNEVGFTPTVRYSASYYDASQKKVQLGEVITVSLTHRMKLHGFFGFELPFDVTVTKSGLSRVYWK